jgi:mannose-6-phosphate isomerase-like protein (cupin superfamily)
MKRLALVAASFMAAACSSNEKQQGGPSLSRTNMSSPISVASAEHYSWCGQCDGWHLVRAPGLSVIQERMPPGTSEERHRHTHSRQFFFVLAGQLQLEVEGVTHTLTAQQGLEIAPGLAHQARNVSSGDVMFLVVSEPPSHGDRELAPVSSVR